MLVMCARGVSAVPGAAPIMIPLSPFVNASWLANLLERNGESLPRLTMGAQEAGERSSRRAATDDQELGLGVDIPAFTHRGSVSRSRRRWGVGPVAVNAVGTINAIGRCAVGRHGARSTLVVLQSFLESRARLMRQVSYSMSVIIRGDG